MALTARGRIGRLSELVTIRRDTSTTKNAYGERSENLTDYMADVWAEVAPLEGDEVVRRGLTFEQHPIQVRIRWDANKSPVPSDRVVWGEENYDVVSVVNEGAGRRFWMLTAVKVV